jgi:acetylornithine deacetylase/succinyl-diaminopimelate desuccinylase-like protein
MVASPAERALAAVSEERVLGLLRRLVDVPSPTGDERACAEALAEHLGGVGVPADLQCFGDRRANVLARAPGRGDGVRLMYCGHLDTGGYGDPARDFALHGLRLSAADRPRSFVADGIVYGLGAYNMKGGVAAAAEALTALVESGAALAGDVLLGAVAGESEKAPVRGALGDWTGAPYEGGGIGAEWLLQHSQRPDAVVICEPSDCVVVNAQPGYLAVKVSLHGRSAYMASKGPHDPGLSAIELAYGVVQALRDWEPRYRETHALDCGMGTLYSPVTVGAIEGGWPFKPGHAPGICNVYVDLRVPPQLDARAALAELEAVVRAGVDTSRGGSHTLEVFASNIPGALTPLDHPLMQAGLRARDTVLGSAQERYPDEDLVPGDDGKVFARVGIPYVKCGPAGLPLAGEKRLGREAIPIRQLVEAARLYVLLALDLASRPRTEIAHWPAVKVAPAAFAAP